MRRVLAMALVGCVACGASATRVRGPDGSEDWYSITCRRGRDNCIEKAGEVCPGGYVVADAGEQQGVYANFNSYQGSSSGTVTTTYRGSMLVKCRMSWATEPATVRQPPPPPPTPYGDLGP